MHDKMFNLGVNVLNRRRQEEFMPTVTLPPQPSESDWSLQISENTWHLSSKVDSEELLIELLGVVHPT